ncbi:MAG: hypothetical protein HY235_14735 [Acidobacteria bacterium]|nr:hypothetical protein [Acidobacteriota bacterium]
MIRQRITTDYHSDGDVVQVGMTLPRVGGAKTSAASALWERVGQDSDAASADYASYLASGHGNGRRVVIMPVQDLSTSVVYGFGMFFLLPAASYDHTGNAAWCAVYVGQAAIPNSPGPGAGTPGAYNIKLVE